ncbi:holin [Cronobacter phage Dev-CD-23823]|uniref:Type II holin n=1 Tax=Cronobacter phage Dev-CD-23823 TaxID=1712539 RepID=A0A0K8IX98_9CAUD|nr:holin [Cronobacter phage Dev-CD-23823]CUH74617.1 Type II holin [Cronobacter phage Dev-CD-23823]
MWLVDTLEKTAPGVPPVVVTGLTVAGVSLQDWVYILTIVYLIVMIVKTIKSLFTRRKKNGEPN